MAELTLEQLKKDKTAIEQQVIAGQGMLVYISQKIAELIKQEEGKENGT